jgi:anti-anti-sigma factor
MIKWLLGTGNRKPEPPRRGNAMLTVNTEMSGDAVVLRCRGRIVRGDEASLLCSAAAHYGQTVVLELSEVELIDASGIGLLVSLQAAGIYLKLMNPSRAVRETLSITHLNSIFEICGSLPGDTNNDTKNEDTPAGGDDHTLAATAAAAWAGV